MIDNQDRVLFGWRIQSEFPLPDLLPWCGDARPADIVVETGSVPVFNDGVVFGPAIRIAADGRVRLAIPAVATYLVEGGARVVIQPAMAIDAPDIRVFLLGTVLAVLCFQRGLLPLHASAVELSGRAVLLAGNSGAGKSTLAASLARRGCRVVADDLCAFSSADSELLIQPAFPRLKLWADAARRLDIPTEGLEQTRAELQKYHVPVDHAGFRATPLPPAHIVLLQRWDVPTPMRVRTLRGIEAMRQRRHMVQRWRLGEALGYGGAIFTALSRLIAAIPLTEVTYGGDLPVAQDLADLVLSLAETA